MILIFHMGTPVSGIELCDIDGILRRVTKSRVKNRKSWQE